MTYTKIRLPEGDEGDRAFRELAHRYHLVGVPEEGEVVFQIPTDAVVTLDQLSLPYEILEAEISTPAGPMGQP